VLAQSIKDPLANRPTPPPPNAAGPVELNTGRVGHLIQLGMLIAAPLVLLALVMKDVLRVGSFDRRRGKRDVQGLPAPVWVGCSMLLFVTSVLGGGIAVGLLKAAGVPDGSQQFGGLTMLGAYLASGSVAALLIYLVKPHATGAGFKVRWWDVPTGVGLLLLALPVLQCVGFLGVMIYTWTQGHPPDAIAHETLHDIMDDRNNPWTWLVIACAIIGAPIIEELTFRVFLQSALLRATRSHWLAILLTSAAFTMIHRPTVPWHALPILFTLGVGLGIAYERTGRPLVPIVMHMVFNAMSVAVVLVST